MKENIAAPLIFSEAEVQDRYRLHQFIYKLFTPCKKGQSHLIGFNSQDLYDLYKLQYPRNVLTTAIVNNVLLMGGFVEEERPGLCNLYATINETNFVAGSKEVQMHILKYMLGPMAIRYRQLLLGVRVNTTTPEGQVANTVSAIHSIDIFIKYWTISKNSRYAQYLKPQHRSTIQEVYDYYRTICRIYGTQIAEKQIFIDQLAKLGYITVKGRVHEKAGHRYFAHLYIPASIEDKLLSVRVNMCCIYNGTSHWTPKGILEDYTEADVSALCNKNLEGMGYDEQERKKIEKEKRTIDIRRTFEDGEIPIGKTKSQDETKDDMGYNEGFKQIIESTQTEDTDFSEDISRTSSFKDEADEFSANECASDEYDADVTDEYPVSTNKLGGRSSLESPSFGKDPIITDDYSEPEFDPLAGRAKDELLAELSDNEVGYEGNTEVGESSGEDIGAASLQEIVNALKVPFQMTPKGQFTRDTMLMWLERMHIELEDTEGYYETIMSMLAQ